ncbi:hypothetical protein [Brevundimonas sp.]|uniref:hypothetical protein n=1 Tax=Brevundimonas sp. TaxID=1871086 RepID=UPI003D0A4FA3
MVPAFHRRLGMIVAALGLSTLGGCATVASEPRTVCSAASPFRPGMETIEGYRVFTGPDGDSAVEPLSIDARHVTLPFNGRVIDIFNLPTAPTRGVQIVAGPANMDLPMHPAPYKEMFILLSGSFTITTRAFSAEMQPGSVLLFEDTDASHGHGGKIGPCGYVSLSIAP